MEFDFQGYFFFVLKLQCVCRCRLTLKHTSKSTGDVLGISVPTIRHICAFSKYIVGTPLVWLLCVFLPWQVLTQALQLIILTDNSALPGPDCPTVSIAWGELGPAGKLTVVLAGDLAGLGEGWHGACMLEAFVDASLPSVLLSTRNGWRKSRELFIANWNVCNYSAI